MVETQGRFGGGQVSDIPSPLSYSSPIGSLVSMVDLASTTKGSVTDLLDIKGISTFWVFGNLVYLLQLCKIIC